MKGTIETGKGNIPIDSGNPWLIFEQWGGNSWFPAHCTEEQKETITDERNERYTDIEPSNK